tara:strand:- start:246 stop:707 length:462 start_codon:yes stop_codon:yes gene_type:complete
MEYKVHKCESAICQCFEVGRILERIKLMTYYEKYNAMKEAYVFAFSFLRNCSSGARTNRLSSKLMEKALPSTKDVKLWAQGIPTSWFIDPPNNSDSWEKYCNKRNEYQDMSRFLKFPTVFGVRGVNNAPPSAETREHVYEPIQRENQTESIAV